MVNPFDEKNYEYTYKNWCDPTKICHLITYDFEILEKDKSEICKTPEFKLTNQIDGTWMMEYKPFGSNSPSSASSLSPASSMISNSPLGGMFKGLMKHITIPNASLTLYVKGNKTVHGRWQWILKSRNPTPSAPRTAEQNRTFVASNSYGLGGPMSLTTFFENGKAIIQIKGLLTWNTDSCKIPCYGLSTIQVQHQSSGIRSGNRSAATSKTTSLRSPLPPPPTVILNETPAYMKISELERRISNLQRDLDQSNDENSILQKEIENLEKENTKLKYEIGTSGMSSVPYNSGETDKLRSQNFQLQQKNQALEEEVKRLKLNQSFSTMYSNTGKAREYVTLRAEDREFGVSKLLLLNNSEILEGHDHTDIISLNCTAATVEPFINFCNSGNFVLDNFDEDICNLLDFVVEHKVDGLKDLIEQNLVSNLNLGNIHKYAEIAENYDLEELFQACLVLAKESLKSSNPISKEGLSSEFKTRLMEMMF